MYEIDMQIEHTWRPCLDDSFHRVVGLQCSNLMSLKCQMHSTFTPFEVQVDNPYLVIVLVGYL